MEVDKEKALEMEKEKIKLSGTIDIINGEILNYLNKRKSISKYIVDYRKKVLEEFKDDEDKIAEYFDHERFVKEEAFTNIDRRLKELTLLKESPYFGKVDFLDKEYEDKEDFYVGRFGVTPEGSYQPAVVDWRAPIASLFYKGTLGESSYTSPQGKIDVEILGRRQYVIKKAKLIGLFDSAVDVKDDILQLVLSSNSGEKLKDIIMTLQKEQDEIIRQPREVTVVVNGVAGSGKTTIALHRVAYLLYNYRDILKDKVLIIGPNKIFMEYISTVLPTLGETGVKQTTFMNFALDILNIDDVMSFGDYTEKILSGDKAFIKEEEYKNSSSYLNYLDEKLKDMDRSYFNINPVIFKGEVIVSEEEIKELFNKHYSYMPLFRRSEKIKRILVSRIKDKRDEEFRRLKAEIKAYKESLSEEKLKEQQNNIEFNRKIKIRELIREVMKSRDEIDLWIIPESVEEIYNHINGNKPLTIDDLAPILYMMLKLKGIKHKEQIKHVVIDEAQDLSLLQLKVIKEITQAVSLTIVGDENQRISGFNRKPGMFSIKDVFPELNVQSFTLNKSYRSTQEIMEYANNYLKEEKILPLVRSGSEVEKIHLEKIDEISELVAEKVESFRTLGLDNIAIITPTLNELEKYEALIKAKTYVSSIKTEDMLYSGGTVLIPSYLAKGLEFDGVIVINKSESSTNDFIKYVMCTRALHSLVEIEL